MHTKRKIIPFNLSNSQLAIRIKGALILITDCQNFFERHSLFTSREVTVPSKLFTVCMALDDIQTNISIRYANLQEREDTF